MSSGNRILVTGWFSFELMGATAGDLLARDVVCAWLSETGREIDVALAPPFQGGVDWRTVDPQEYSVVIFVCGPFGNGPPVTEFLARFAGRRMIGLDLTMLDPLEQWNPFDLLLERDSSAAARPDLAFLAPLRRVPAAGLILIHPQREYGMRGRASLANGALERLAGRHELSAVAIDTRLDINGTGLRTPQEVESLIARVDVVLTTRLHGMVLALKNGIPPIVIDPIAGGAKITRQASAVGWPLLFPVDTLADAALDDALAYCLTEDAHLRARRCAEGARRQLEEVHRRFIAGLDPASPNEPER